MQPNTRPKGSGDGKKVNTFAMGKISRACQGGFGEGPVHHLREKLLATGSFGEGVQLEQRPQILERILLERAALLGCFWWAHYALDFVAVDQAGEV